MADSLLVTLADTNYMEQAKQLFSSVYHNSGWRGDYMLLSQGMSVGDIAWFRDKGILVKSVKPVPGIEFPHHSRTVLGKFFLFGQEFSEWEKIVFLDADTMVTSSLDGLLDLEGFCAVADFHGIGLGKQFKERSELKSNEERDAYKRLSSSYDLGRVSFNSGVMAFDGSITGKECLEELMGLYREYEPITLHDQSTFNLQFYSKWKRLPFVYNNYFLHGRDPWSIRYHRCDGIVNHYILNRIWKTKDPQLYPDWERNLSLSERIDLGHRLPARRVWTEKEIEDTSFYLESSHPSPDTLKGLFLNGVSGICSMAGRAGSGIRKAFLGDTGSDGKGRTDPPDPT